LTFKKVCVQPRPSAVNTTLPVFAAERRAAAPLLLSAPAAGTCRSISPAGRALSSKPAGHVDQWDRETNERTLDRFIDPADYTSSQ